MKISLVSLSIGVSLFSVNSLAQSPSPEKSVVEELQSAGPDIVKTLRSYPEPNMNSHLGQLFKEGGATGYHRYTSNTLYSALEGTDYYHTEINPNKMKPSEIWDVLKNVETRVTAFIKTEVAQLEKSIGERLSSLKAGNFKTFEVSPKWNSKADEVKKFWEDLAHDIQTLDRKTFGQKYQLESNGRLMHLKSDADALKVFQANQRAIIRSILLSFGKFNFPNLSNSSNGSFYSWWIKQAELMGTQASSAIRSGQSLAGLGAKQYRGLPYLAMFLLVASGDFDEIKRNGRDMIRPFKEGAAYLGEQVSQIGLHDKSAANTAASSKSIFVSGKPASR